MTSSSDLISQYLSATSFNLALSSEPTAKLTASSAVSMTHTVGSGFGDSSLAIQDAASKSMDSAWTKLWYFQQDYSVAKISSSHGTGVSESTMLSAREAVQRLKNFPSYLVGGTDAITSISPRRRQLTEAPPAIEILAEWDGYVENIFDKYFVGRMRGLYGPGVAGKDEEAEIPISDVDAADMDLVALGGFFRLTIAYEFPRVGNKRRYTTVQFRRLPAYSKRDIDEIQRKTNELMNAIQLDDDRQSASAGRG